MVDQASVNRGNGTQHQASPFTVVGNIADFGSDITSLLELQAKLTALDAREAANQATRPLVFLGAGLVLALASLPVILIGVADLIATTLKISAGSAQLIVGLVALALAGAGIFLGVRGSLSSLNCFRRSREELIRNLSWIRTVLIYSGRSGGRHRV